MFIESHKSFLGSYIDMLNLYPFCVMHYLEWMDHINKHSGRIRIDI